MIKPCKKKEKERDDPTEMVVRIQGEMATGVCTCQQSQPGQMFPIFGVVSGRLWLSVSSATLEPLFSPLFPLSA